MKIRKVHSASTYILNELNQIEISPVFTQGERLTLWDAWNESKPILVKQLTRGIGIMLPPESRIGLPTGLFVSGLSKDTVLEVDVSPSASLTKGLMSIGSTIITEDGEITVGCYNASDSLVAIVNGDVIGIGKLTKISSVPIENE